MNNLFVFVLMYDTDPHPQIVVSMIMLAHCSILCSLRYDVTFHYNFYILFYIKFCYKAIQMLLRTINIKTLFIKLNSETSTISRANICFYLRQTIYITKRSNCFNILMLKKLIKKCLEYINFNYFIRL